jgi:nitroreductase
MEFTKVISVRRAIRKYKPDPIPEKKLQKLYKALQAAPTGNNRQPFRFIFVKDPGKRLQIATKACHQDFLKEPPVLMAACCEKGHSFDTAIAVDHMTLAAADEGLGTCWIGWFEQNVVKEILGIPDNMEVPVLIPIGFPAENPPAKARKSIDELVTVV